MTRTPHAQTHKGDAALEITAEAHAPWAMMRSRSWSDGGSVCPLMTTATPENSELIGAPAS